MRQTAGGCTGDRTRVSRQWTRCSTGGDGRARYAAELGNRCPTFLRPDGPRPAPDDRDPGRGTGTPVHRRRRRVLESTRRKHGPGLTARLGMTQWVRFPGPTPGWSPWPHSMSRRTSRSEAGQPGVGPGQQGSRPCVRRNGRGAWAAESRPGSTSGARRESEPVEERPSGSHNRLGGPQAVRLLPPGQEGGGPSGLAVGQAGRTRWPTWGRGAWKKASDALEARARVKAVIGRSGAGTRLRGPDQA